MAKKSGTSSWLTAVKRAFRSPTKETNAERNSPCRRRDENEDEEQKKREKRRWLFRKPAHFQASNNQQSDQTKIGDAKPDDDIIETKDVITSSASAVDMAEQKHAIPVAATKNVNRLSKRKTLRREHYYAAVIIQTAFRGYLARRALSALKGLVKLQALVRGQNVRKQAKLTLKCMQALVRVQDHVTHQRARLSLESRRKSMLAELTTSLWDSTSFHDLRDRFSISKEMSNGDWDDCPQTCEEIEAKLQVRKEAVLKREKALAYAFSQQIRRGRKNPSMGNEDEMDDRNKWLDRWMATKQWESDYSSDRRDQNIRTVEVDTPNTKRAHQTLKAQNKGPYSTPSVPSSPAHKAQFTTPSPSKPKPLKIRSASPRCPREDRCHTPNYMAATQSARARARPNSTPRLRPATPERGGGACSTVKKRLSYNAARESLGLHFRSPSFKSLQNGVFYGVESLSSCYDESVYGRDVSPCSTTDLRWLN